MASKQEYFTVTGDTLLTAFSFAFFCGSMAGIIAVVCAWWVLR